MKRTSKGHVGCLPFVLACIALWALCFGVTYHGVHYGLRCSCAHGVQVDEGAP